MSSTNLVLPKAARNTAAFFVFLVASTTSTLDANADSWEVYHIKSTAIFNSSLKLRLRWEINPESIHRNGNTTYLNTRIFSPSINQYTVMNDVEVNCEDAIIQEISYASGGSKNEHVMFRQADGRWFDISAVEKGERDSSLEGHYLDEDARHEKVFTKACK